MARAGGQRRAPKRRKPGVDAETFCAWPAERRRGPLVMAVGEEQLLQREVAEAVCTAFDGAERHVLHGVAQRGGPEPQAVLDRLRTPSLFGAPEVVVVREADPFAEAAAKGLVRWAEAKRRGCALVLLLRKLPEGRSKVGKALRAAATIVDCAPPYDSPPPWKPHAAPWETPLHEWVCRRARRLRVALTPQLAHVIVEATGRDLSEIAATLEKLRLLLGDAGRCTPDHIEAVVGHTRRDGAFALVDAIVSGDAARAFAALERAFESGLDMGDSVVSDASGIAMVMLGMLRRVLDEVRRVRAHLEGGGKPDPRALASALGMSPLVAQRALGLARRWSAPTLLARYRTLLACDRGVKGRLGARAAMEVLVAQWSSAARRAAR